MSAEGYNELHANNLMDDFQYEAIYNWRVSNGGTLKRPAADAGKVLEEVLELCFKSGMVIAELDNIIARETYKALKRGECAGEFNRDGVTEEYADVAITLASYAQKLDLDTDQAVESGLTKIKNRVWSPDEDGILCRPRDQVTAQQPMHKLPDDES